MLFKPCKVRRQCRAISNVTLSHAFQFGVVLDGFGITNERANLFYILLAALATSTHQSPNPQRLWEDPKPRHYVSCGDRKWNDINWTQRCCDEANGEEYWTAPLVPVTARSSCVNPDVKLFREIGRTLKRQTSLQ